MLAGSLAQLALVRALCQRARASKHANILETCSFSKHPFDIIYTDFETYITHMYICIFVYIHPRGSKYSNTEYLA